MAVELLSVSEVARRVGIAPRVLSDLFYLKRLDDKRCPVIGGRRVVPVTYIPTIRAVLKRRGWLAPPGSRARR